MHHIKHHDTREQEHPKETTTQSKLILIINSLEDVPPSFAHDLHSCDLSGCHLTASSLNRSAQHQIQCVPLKITCKHELVFAWYLKNHIISTQPQSPTQG
jgi:hypothetical protein